MSRIFTFVLAMLALSVSNYAQQVKNTGVTSDLPLKTVVIKDGKTDNAAAYLSANTIIRFWVFKPGSTADVQRIVKSLRAKDGVLELEEAGVSGDYKEFVLRLKAPREKKWFMQVFAEAGITHLQFNNGKPQPVDKL